MTAIPRKDWHRPTALGASKCSSPDSRPAPLPRRRPAPAAAQSPLSSYGGSHHSWRTDSGSCASNSRLGTATHDRGAGCHPPPRTAPPRSASSQAPPRRDSPTQSEVYSHNPYASSCTVASFSLDTSMDSYRSFYSTYSTASNTPTTQPLVNTNTYTEAVGGANYPDHLLSLIGNIAATACSARGRQALVPALRSRQLESVEAIFNELAPEVNIVATDPHGCHVVRALVECISAEWMDSLAPCFTAETILSLATISQHTRRVVQSMFERHKTDAFFPIVEAIASDCLHVATTQQGCITIMRVLENALPAQKHLLISQLIPWLPTLTTDPFGNYVAQCVLQNTDKFISFDAVCDGFKGHWLSLCCNKFASNVMEKVVRRMDASMHREIVEELILDPTSLHCLMQDSFGNFVLQAIVDSSKDAAEFTTIYDVVFPQLSSSPYGHKIEAKLKSKCAAFYGSCSNPCRGSAKS